MAEVMKRAARPIGTIRSGAVFCLSPTISTSARIEAAAAKREWAMNRGAPQFVGKPPDVAATETAASGVIAR
jgi:hypothetical protein